MDDQDPMSITVRLDTLRILMAPHMPQRAVKDVLADADALARFALYGSVPVEAQPIADTPPPSPDTPVVHSFDDDGRMLPPGTSFEETAPIPQAIWDGLVLQNPAAARPNEPPPARLLDPETLRPMPEPVAAAQTADVPASDESETIAGNVTNQDGSLISTPVPEEEVPPTQTPQPGFQSTGN